MPRQENPAIDGKTSDQQSIVSDPLSGPLHFETFDCPTALPTIRRDDQSPQDPLVSQLWLRRV